MKKISQSMMDQIANYMDDDTRERVCRELASCEPEEFLKRYCELEPEFEDFLMDEFSIELDDGVFVCTAEDDEELTDDELLAIKKHQKVRKLSKCGEFTETFLCNYVRIPENLREKLSPEDLASLVDAFYKCYSDGKNSIK